MSLAERLQSAWNSHDGKQVADLFTEGCVRRHMAMDPASPYTSRTAIAEAAQSILDAWPDSVLDIRSATEGAGGTVTVEWTFRGTHQRDWGILPARGEETDLPGVSIFEMDGDLVSEERAYWDNAILLAGAGLLEG